MDIKRNQIDELTFAYTVFVPKEEINKEIDKELVEYAKDYKMPGFRPGKVPLDLLKKRHLKDVHAHIIKNFIETQTKKITDAPNIELASTPVVKNEKSELGEDLSYELVVELMPEFNLPEINISLEKPLYKADEKEVEKEVKNLAAKNLEFIKSETEKTKSAKGDKVIIDFEGSIGGKLFEGGAGKDFALVLGSQSFIGDFEEQLQSKKLGEKVLVKVSFPENYPSPEVAGKEAEFSVTINEIHKPGKAAINDELAKRLEFENLNALKEKIAKDMESALAKDIDFMVRKSLFDSIIDIVEFTIPNSILNQEKEIITKDFEKDKSEEKSDEMIEKIAKRRVKLGLLLSKIAKKYNIQVINKDIQEYITAQANEFPAMSQQIIDFYYNNPQMIRSLTGTILENKVVTHLLNKHVTFNEKQYNLEELEKRILDFENLENL